MTEPRFLLSGIPQQSATQRAQEPSQAWRRSAGILAQAVAFPGGVMEIHGGPTLWHPLLSIYSVGTLCFDVVELVEWVGLRPDLCGLKSMATVGSLYELNIMCRVPNKQCG